MARPAGLLHRPMGQEVLRPQAIMQYESMQELSPPHLLYQHHWSGACCHDMQSAASTAGSRQPGCSCTVSLHLEIFFMTWIHAWMPVPAVTSIHACWEHGFNCRLIRWHGHLLQLLQQLINQAAPDSLKCLDVGGVAIQTRGLYAVHAQSDQCKQALDAGSGCRLWMAGAFCNPLMYCSSK